MSLATDADALSSLPVDLLTDSLLPAFPAHDLVSLARTCRRWLAFITSEGGPCEILWQRKAVKEMHFPAVTSGRRSGWYRLYARLASSSAYLWGVSSGALSHARTKLTRLSTLAANEQRTTRTADAAMGNRAHLVPPHPYRPRRPHPPNTHRSPLSTRLARGRRMVLPRSDGGRTGGQLGTDVGLGDPVGGCAA